MIAADNADVDLDVPANSEDDNAKYYWNKRDKLTWMLTFFVGHLLVYSARSTMSISIPTISKELGWNKEVSGSALSAFFAGYLCTNMIGGYAADRMGGEVVICYTAIGWSLLTLLLPYIARSQVLSPFSTGAVIVARFFTGLFQGVFYPSMASITAKHVAIADRGFFQGFTNSGAYVGSAATGFVGSLILQYFNWQLVFVIIGCASLLWVAWLRYLLAYIDRVRILKLSTKQQSLPWRRLGIIYRFVQWELLFQHWLSWAPVFFHDTFPHRKGWMFNTVPWVLAFVWGNLAGYVGNVLISRNVSVTTVRKVFATFHLLGLCLCSLLLNYVQGYHQALLVMSVNIGVDAFSNFSLNSQDLAPTHAGSLHGFLNGFGAVAGVIGVYLTGYILRSTGQKWAVVLLLNAMLSFIGWASFIIFGSGKRVV